MDGIGQSNNKLYITRITGYWETTEIWIGDLQAERLVPMFLPECMFDYPDDNGTNIEFITALNGTGMYYPCTFKNKL